MTNKNLQSVHEDVKSKKEFETALHNIVVEQFTVNKTQDIVEEVMSFIAHRETVAWNACLDSKRRNDTVSSTTFRKGWWLLYILCFDRCTLHFQ